MITRNNQETPSSRVGNSRSKRISGRNDGFATWWRVAWRGSWIKRKCTANVNENDDREFDEDNYSEENEAVKSDDDEISVVDL